MVNPQTLRGRLTLTYATALTLALIAFSAIALAVSDRVQRNALDAQLQTVARAVGAIAGEAGGRVRMDSRDQEQFAGIVGSKVSAAVFQRSGDVVISSSRRTPSAIRDASLGVTRPAFRTLAIGREQIRLFVEPIAQDASVAGTIAVWRDADAVEALDRGLAIGFALAIPVLAALAVVFGAGIARRGLAPLQRIATVASEIEARDLSRRLALPPRNDELGQLAATFDRMLDRLQRAFSREREFTSAASHELRAPLSVIRAEADLALRSERDPEEYRRALRVIAEEADALEQLTRDLLAAARADAAAGEPRARVDLYAVAATVAERIAALARERDLHVAVPCDETASTIVAAAPDALERAVLTIAHNAIKYARRGGTVELHASRDGDTVQLEVRDDGPGFSEAGLQHAFDRFWRDDQGRDGEGTGLGLAIARAIVDGSGGTITLDNRRSGGAVVRLRFPAQPPEGARSS